MAGSRVSAFALVVGLVGAVAACGSSNQATASAGARTSAPSATASATKSARVVPSLPSYWTLHRLDLAGALGDVQAPQRGRRLAEQSVRVGALFTTDKQGNHFCTASSVDSPHGDLVITAAHCVYDVASGGLQTNIAFVPAFRHGHEPDGVWTPKSFIIDPRWERYADPDLDVAFIVMEPLAGKSVADVLGANAIAFNTSYTQVVRVTGYPKTADAAITCVNSTKKQSATQLRFDCDGFPGGTSGSPWVVRPDTHSGTGTIVGVIGGYQQGGDTSAVSYSAYFGADIEKLYERAKAAG